MAAFNCVALDTLDIKQFHKTGDINDTSPAKCVLIVGKRFCMAFRKLRYSKENVSPAFMNVK